MERRYLAQLERFLSNAPEEAALIEECQGRYVQKLPEFRPSSYGL
jgi:hypothetical protein